MWPFDDLVDEWLERIIAARKAGEPPPDADETDWDGMEQNELSPRYKR